MTHCAAAAFYFWGREELYITIQLIAWDAVQIAFVVESVHCLLFILMCEERSRVLSLLQATISQCWTCCKLTYAAGVQLLLLWTVCCPIVQLLTALCCPSNGASRVARAQGPEAWNDYNPLACWLQDDVLMF
jgi:hypothetical protein